MAVTRYFLNVDRAILDTVFENTVQRVNKCLETGGRHFEHYYNLEVCHLHCVCENWKGYVVKQNYVN